MDLIDYATLVVLLVPAVLGVRATIRLWRRVFFNEETRRSPILRALAIVATILTLAALWFGWLAVRRLIGLAPVQEAAEVSLAISAIVLLIPAGIDWLVDRIERGKL